MYKRQVTFLALAANFALWFRSPVPASAALALAMAARPHVLLMWPLLLGLSRIRRGGEARMKRWVDDWLDAFRTQRRWIAGSLVGPAVVLAGLGAYNQARFHNPLDFGYYAQKIEAGLMGPLFMDGQFSIAHLPRNLHTLLLKSGHRDRWTGRWTPDEIGMSVILTSPALLWIVFAVRRRDPATRGAWVAAGLVLLPLLLYYNTGWQQFGYRFLLDLIVPLLVLLANAAGRRIHPILGALILVSIAANLMGTIWWFTEVSLPQ